MEIEEGFKSYGHVYSIFWDDRTYLVPTNAMAKFCAAVNAGYEPRKWGRGEYLAKAEDLKVLPTGLPEVPDEWKGYVLANQIHGKVGHAVSRREAWVNLGKSQGFCRG